MPFPAPSKRSRPSRTSSRTKIRRRSPAFAVYDYAARPPPKCPESSIPAISNPTLSRYRARTVAKSRELARTTGSLSFKSFVESEWEQRWRAATDGLRGEHFLRIRLPWRTKPPPKEKGEICSRTLAWKAVSNVLSRVSPVKQLTGLALPSPASSHRAHIVVAAGFRLNHAKVNYQSKDNRAKSRVPEASKHAQRAQPHHGPMTCEQDISPIIVSGLRIMCTPHITA
jgi:hypothetical protein